MSAPDLRLGRYQDVLADVECDASIADPPFGERTHASWREGGAAAKLKRGAITYAHWTPDDVRDYVKAWSDRTRGWMVAMTSHDLCEAWQDEFESAGRYSFAPIPFVTIGGSIRLAGDGPSNWTVWLMVARPRTRKMQKWGTLPGAYILQGGANTWAHDESGGGRGKSLDGMRAIVRDYSRACDLICDPCGGLATTGVAALGMGRRFVGAEMDPATHGRGLRRLAAVQPVDLFDPGRAQQAPLFAEPPRATRRKKAA